FANARTERSKHMATSYTGDLHRATTWSIVLSLLMIGVGVVAIATPAMAGVAVTLILGWLLMISGVLHLALAWRGERASAIIWEILLALLYGAIGFYLITQPVAGLATLTLALAVYLVIEAVIEFVLAFQLRPAAGTGWLLFDGIVTLLLAGLVWSSW